MNPFERLLACYEYTISVKCFHNYVSYRQCLVKCLSPLHKRLHILVVVLNFYCFFVNLLGKSKEARFRLFGKSKFQSTRKSVNSFEGYAVSLEDLKAHYGAVFQVG